MLDSSHLIKGNSFDEIFGQLLHQLLNKPMNVCSPRGSKINENICTTLILEDPRSRLLGSASRAANYGFAVGEFLWYWQGKKDLSTMSYYNKRMNSFSNDGHTLNSAYGYRLKKRFFFANETAPGQGHTQWETTKRTLLEDQSSRRAVMSINQPEDEVAAMSGHGSKDVPCTLSLQFFIRNNKLDLHVHMRSNDVMWGLTYDLFSFTLFQECMLLELKDAGLKDLSLGRYYHSAGSMHLYEQHFEQAKNILSEYKFSNEECTMNWTHPQYPIDSIKNLDYVCEYEAELRTRNARHNVGRAELGETERWMIEELTKHKDKRIREENS